MLTSMSADGLRGILLDTKAGAAALAHAALAWLKDHPQLLAPENREGTLRILCRARPEMAGFAALASRLEREFESPGANTPSVILRRLEDRLGADERRMVANALAELAAIRARSVATLSYSSSVAAALEASSGESATVHVLESLPGGEGRELADRLRQTLPDVRLHRDTELAAVVEQADAGVIGADSVYPNGSVLNKVLSAELGQRLAEAGKPLLVLATTWKKVGANEDINAVGNLEVVPARWITRIVTE